MTAARTARVIGRAPETPSTRVVRRPTPTLEDAELQPEGLQVIELNGPTWVGPWLLRFTDSYRRGLLVFNDDNNKAVLAFAYIWDHHDKRWSFECDGRPVLFVRGEGHPTPEAAQQACEAAIVAAWRNR